MVFNRKGDYWPIRQIGTNDEAGTAILMRGAVQWASNRGVVVLNDLNNGLCVSCFEVVHIVQQDGVWLAMLALEAKGQNVVRIDFPTLRLIDGYRTISLTLTSYDDPPCTLDSETQERLAWTIYITEHSYQWDETDYLATGKHILDTKIILYAGEHRETYERLVNWEAHCAA